MCPEPLAQGNPRGRTSASSWKKSSELSAIPYQSLDLTPGAGNLLGEFFWEILSPWRGASLMLNSGASPRDGVESSLWQILEEQPHPKYYLTRKACLGILRRASERGKELPEQLRVALEIQAGLREADYQTVPGEAVAFAANQRDEVRDLHDVAGALGAQPGMKQQTFIAEQTPVLCLNDQGGQVMDCTENITGTLRAQMHSHQPLILESNQEHAQVREDGVSPTLPASMGMGGGYVPMVYENHGIDARYTGPHEVSPTLSARCGTGGNNVPLVEQEPVFCISGNSIDRQPQNGGNGLGCQENVAYTLTATDHHAVFSRQRVDFFLENEVASTESARQHKDATDLVIQRSNDEHIHTSQNTKLIRRLSSLECERLQGLCGAEENAKLFGKSGQNWRRSAK